jgi:hypothetical protein
MRDLIRMAGHAYHYLHDVHTAAELGSGGREEQ